MPLVGRQSLAPGDAGTDQTVKEMNRMVDKARSCLRLRAVARYILRAARVPARDIGGEISALFSFVRDRIRYVRDPIDVELVHDPLNTLRVGAGDCDDKAVLLAGLLQTIGHKTRFKVVALRRGDFHHVLLDVMYRGQWVPLDPGAEHAPPGWQHPGVVRSRTYGESKDMAELGSYDFRQVEQVADMASREIVESSARGALAAELVAGRISSTDLRLTRAFLRREGKFFMPAWQRHMLDRLAIEAQGVLRGRPSLDLGGGGVAGGNGEGNLGGFFSSVWKGIKSVAKSVFTVATTPIKLVTAAVTGKNVWSVFKSHMKAVGTIAKVIGPALVLVPGVGPVAAAAVTMAGEIIAPGETIPAGAIAVSQIPVGETFVMQAPSAPLTPIVAAGTAVEPVSAATSAIMIPGLPAGIPWYVLAGGLMAFMLLITRR